MAEIEWVEVKGIKGKSIGAIGFIGNNAVAVATFIEDEDGNEDGEVSWGEWIASKVSPLSLDGYAATKVAMAARVDMDILMRDPSFNQMAMNMYLNFARGLIADGVWTVYFSRGVNMVGGGVAKIITKGMVKQLVIRKGFEKAVREAFDAATAPAT